MSAFDDAIAAHFSALQTMHGIDVTIARGASSCTGVTAVLAGTDRQALTSREAMYQSDRQDLIIALADYKPAGTAVPPAKGDRISYVQASQTVTLELLPPDDARDCFVRWKGGNYFRVHGKVISREAV